MNGSPTVSQSSDRFAIEVDGRPAGFTQFAERDGRRIFFHTEIGDGFEGQGLASVLVRRALDATRAEELRAVAVCPYVKGWVEKHADYADLTERPTPDDLDAVRAAQA
jgi:predicted GNAT family acetyltransferase